MKRNIIPFAGLLLVTLVIAGCGGGGGGGGGTVPWFAGPPADGTTPPPAQVDPVDTFVAYVKDLIGKALDTAEPADVARFDPPPTTETKEPVSTE